MQEVASVGIDRKKKTSFGAELDYCYLLDNSARGTLEFHSSAYTSHVAKNNCE